MTKKTFTEIRADVEQKRIEADLQVLATAHVVLDESVERWQELIDHAKAVQAEIENLCETPNPTPLQVQVLTAKAERARDAR